MSNLKYQMSNIALAGFMGTGKSTVGKLVAERLGLAFIDTDEVIVERAGRPIAEIFAQDGEQAFRQLEADVCLEVGGGGGQVIALGGGALLNVRTREMVNARCLIVCLFCDLDEIVRRVADASGNDPTRPLFARDRVASLLASRSEHYASLPYHIDTTEMLPQQVAEEVIRLWQTH
jgi:shikimate kinase